MSITNRVSEPADGQRQAPEEEPCDTHQHMKSYIRLSCSRRLSAHAACAQHEDDPDGAVKCPEDGVVSVPSIPPHDPKIPARLRPILPPANFGAVVKNCIYRSSYPQVENYGFLKSLGLKTILTLVPEPISPEYQRFMAEHGIQHFQVHIPANKGEIKINACEMTRALEIVLDRSNHPMLIHCNKGKHRTGCVVGCFRRVQGEEDDDVFDEYHAYAGAKARLLDEAFIEQFNENTVLWMARRYNWLPPILGLTPPSPVSIASNSSADFVMTRT